jgi:chemotaxis signal transduction protein
LENYLKFRVARHEYFIPLKNVVRVLPAVVIRDYPAKDTLNLLGYVIIEGEPIAVIDIYHRAGIVFEGIELSHKMVLMNWNNFRFLIVADEVSDITELDTSIFKNFAINTFSSASVLVDSNGRYIINDIGLFINEDTLINLFTGERILSGEEIE